MVGICPGGICPVGICPAGICPGGICPGGICPGGICPDTLYFISNTCHMSTVLLYNEKNKICYDFV